MQYPFSCARRIWHPDGYAVNETMEFFREVQVSRPDRCRFFIHVNSHYALYVNGQFAANDSFPDYEQYQIYDEIDLSALLQPGRNTLLITAYCQGEDSSTYRAYPAGLSYALWEEQQLLAASDSATLVRRDVRYASRNVSKICNQLSYSFDYNACLPLPPYQASAVLGPCPDMHPRPICKLQLEPPASAAVLASGHFTDSDPSSEQVYAARMQKAALTASAPSSACLLPSQDGIFQPDNWCLIDLKKEQAGYLLLDLTLPQEADILIGWGEHLEDLRVRTHVGGRCFAARFRGKAGRNTFFYPIKRLGLRYLQLHVYTTGWTLYYAGVLPALYPVSKVNLFTCADHLHTQIYRTCLRTLQACMHEHYEDCPWREQALYTMDSRNQMLCGYYAFEEYAFARASLKLMGLSLRPDHLLELTSPARVDVTIPSFSAMYLVQLAEYLQYSGDSAFAEEMLPVARDIAEGFLARIDANGLLPRYEGAAYWNFYEWQTGLEGRLGVDEASGQAVYDAPLSAFVSLSLQHLSRLCRTLGQNELADRYQTQSFSLNQAMDTAFFDEEASCYGTTLLDGVLMHRAELTQALFLLCGAARNPEQLRRHLAGLTDIRFSPITLSHSIFKYEALMQQPELYARCVFDDIAAQFGGMLYQNATTFWETQGGASAFDQAGSLCHGWSAIPVYFYLRYSADLFQEGKQLPPEKTGLYEPRITVFPHAASRIQQDRWETDFSH